jgi:hypothetical protein
MGVEVIESGRDFGDSKSLPKDNLALMDLLVDISADDSLHQLDERTLAGDLECCGSSECRAHTTLLEELVELDWKCSKLVLF